MGKARMDEDAKVKDRFVVIARERVFMLAGCVLGTSAAFRCSRQIQENVTIYGSDLRRRGKQVPKDRQVLTVSILKFC